MKRIMLILMILALSSFGAADFDGSDDCIDTGYIVSLGSSDNYSFSYWVNGDNFDATEQQVTGFNKSGTIIQSGFADACTYDDQVECLFRGDDSAIHTACSTTRMAEGTWYHVACVWDAGSSVKVYVNGVNEGTDSSVTSSVYSNATDDIGIGGRECGLNFEGKIEEFYYWRDQLTNADISLLASSRTRYIGCQIKPSTLEKYLPLNECSEGASCDGLEFVQPCPTVDTATSTGNDGAGNTGLTGYAGMNLSYP